MKIGTFLASLFISVAFTSCTSARGDGSNNLSVVVIAGTKWTTANLTTSGGATSGHRVSSSPSDFGSYFKWGSTYTYDGINVGEGWGSETTGAANTPTRSLTNQRGYDYVGLSGMIKHPGDPCYSLGANYRTPTRIEWESLISSGFTAGVYKMVNGYFFGPNHARCTNMAIVFGCIFVPASGARFWQDGLLNEVDVEGCYWSSTVYNNNNGYILYFDQSNLGADFFDARANAFSVRCVAS